MTTLMMSSIDPIHPGVSLIKGLIVQLADFHSSRPFIWLGKIVNFFINKTLNYMSLDWRT